MFETLNSFHVQLSVCVDFWTCVSARVVCSCNGVPAALRPGDRTQPPMLGQQG